MKVTNWMKWGALEVYDYEDGSSRIILNGGKK